MALLILLIYGLFLNRFVFTDRTLNKVMTLAMNLVDFLI